MVEKALPCRRSYRHVKTYGNNTCLDLDRKPHWKRERFVRTKRARHRKQLSRRKGHSTKEVGERPRKTHRAPGLVKENAQRMHVRRFPLTRDSRQWFSQRKTKGPRTRSESFLVRVHDGKLLVSLSFLLRFKHARGENGPVDTTDVRD